MSQHSRCRTFALFTLCLTVAPLAGAQKRDAVRLPLTFERNQGQVNSEVRFLSRSGQASFFLTDDEIVLTSRIGGSRQSVRMRFLGSAAAIPAGESRSGGFANYYRSWDAAKWNRGIPLFSRVRYADIYPGIDAVFHGSKDQLEFDFEVSPGASPDEVSVAFGGADRVTVSADSGLEIVCGGKTWRFLPPVAFQMKDNIRAQVRASYRLMKDGSIGFELGDFDHYAKLVIDPVLAYADELSAGNEIDVSAIQADAAGDLFVAGQTFASDYPVKNGRGPNPGGTEQVYLTKVNPAGDTILYSTYLPASAFSSARTLAVDGNGNAYVAGIAGAADFPVTSTNLGTCNQFCNAGFVAKFAPDGSMSYSTLLASGQVLPTSITVDGNGSAYVAGSADGSLVTVNAFQATGPGAFFAKLNPTGTNYVFASYFADTSSSTLAKGIALDGSGNIFVAGIAAGDPPLMKPWQSKNGVLFLAKFAADGKTLLFSTRFGASGTENVEPLFQALTGMTIGPDGTIYLVGSEGGQDYPYAVDAAWHPLASSTSGTSNMFATAIDPTLSKLTYSTYLGDGFANAIAVDTASHLHIVGSGAFNLPAMKNGVEADVIRPGDGFILELDSTGALVTVSKFGGEFTPEVPTAVAVDPLKNLYLAGGFSPTSTSGVLAADPITVGPVIGSSAGSYMSFFAKIISASSRQISLHSSGPIISVRNVGSADLHISNIALSGGLSKRWGNCQDTVPGGSSCFLTVSDANGLTASGTVTITSDAQPALQSIAVTGPQPPGQPIGDILYFPNAPLAYPPQLQGTTTGALPVKIWNIGAANGTITSVTTNGFASQTNNCGVLAPGASCAVQVSATPTDSSNQGSLQIFYDTNGMQEYDNLFVVASAQQILLSANSINFGIQQVGGVAIPRAVTVTNTGNTAISAPLPSITGDQEFVLAGNTCTTALASHQSCAIGVQFNPAIDGARSGNLNVAGQQVSLNAQGQIGSVVQVSPLELDFFPEVVGTIQPATLTLTNGPSAAVPIVGVSFSLGDYSETDTCQGQVPAAGVCTMTVNFAPTNVGTRNGQMSITFGGGAVAQVLTLTGSGVTPLMVMPSSLDFGSSTLVGTSSNVQFVELQNGGPGTIPYSVSVSGDFAAVNTCATPFPQFWGCPVNITFQPKATGVRTGALTISYPNISVRSVVTLTGTAVPQFTMQGASGTALTATVKSGSTATYQLSLAGASGFTGTVQLACAGAPQFASCTVQPASISFPAASSVIAAITVTTSTGASAEVVRSSPSVLWAVLLIPALLSFRRRARIALLLVCLAFIGSGCGGGSASPSSPTPPVVPPTSNATAPGSYTLQVTATGGATTQTLTLTLVVQ